MCSGHLLAILKKPLRAFSKPRQLRQLDFVENHRSAKRDKSDQGAHSKRDRLSVIGKMIVVEPVLFIPQACRVYCIRRVGDSHIMLEKLAGHVGVSGSLKCKLKRHVQHDSTEKRHPGGRIRLVQGNRPSAEVYCGRTLRYCRAPGIRR